MTLPFTQEQFLEVFARYNTAIWPMQIVAYVLGITAVALAIKKTSASGRAIALIPAFLWLWVGWMYDVVHLVTINKAAHLFGALFILEGAALLLAGVVWPKLSFRAGSGVRGLVASATIVYAMIIYPIIGSLLGHGYPRSPGFGVAPCAGVEAS